MQLWIEVTSSKTILITLNIQELNGITPTLDIKITKGKRHFLTSVMVSNLCVFLYYFIQE